MRSLKPINTSIPQSPPSKSQLNAQLASIKCCSKKHIDTFTTQFSHPPSKPMKLKQVLQLPPCNKFTPAFILHVPGSVISTINIALIKRDGVRVGNPIRVKYRIVALGNMDPHNWEK